MLHRLFSLLPSYFQRLIVSLGLYYKHAFILYQIQIPMNEVLDDRLPAGSKILSKETRAREAMISLSSCGSGKIILLFN